MSAALGHRALQAGLAVWMATAGASTADSLTGVAVPNIIWQSPQDIDDTLADIRAADFEAVRIGWKAPLDAARLAVREARAQGLEVLVTLPLIDGTISREGAVARPRTDRFFAVHGLSQIDPVRLQQRLRELIDFAANEGIALAGIEIGNEMNWSGYNGDLPLAPQGAVIDNLAHMAPLDRQAFLAGLQAYVDALGIARAALDDAGMTGKTALVMGGLADINSPFIRSSGATYVDPVLTHALLGDLGAFEAIDAVGIHLYEPLRLAMADADRAGMIRSQLAGCFTADYGGASCWITEFGTAEPDAGCSLDDRERRQMLAPLSNYLRDPATAGRIGATFYYDWDGDAAFSLVRCGQPTRLTLDLTQTLH
ncbi:hypothetical protein [uncultured Devosia sp.]|uniref:hypothetical protein n=1 Tax=uncultured Devosia sp. TaxID=211434 RepID=UPI0035CB84D8